MKMNRRSFLRTTSLGVAGLALNQAISCSGNRKPNIVLIFIDDQGYADLGCYGAKGFKTPNIDKLAGEGMRFTQFYASQAVCSASRASLLTGCYAERVDISGALNPWAQHGLNPNEETIAELLKKQEYARAIVGKWHLGHLEEFLPLQHGFDEYFGIPYSNDMWPVGFDGKPVAESHKAFYPPLPLIEGNREIEKIETLQDQNKLTTRYTEYAVDFIKRKNNQPFFLYLAHTMVHVPLGVSEKFRGKSEQGMFGDVMMEVDWSVGQVMETLQKNGLDENTLVIYTSDNGPWLNFGNHAGSARPLREGKGTAFEGGPRVPCIMRWPGHVPAGEECNKMAATIDILPTICNITQTNLPEQKIDGTNILPLLEGNKQANPRDEFYYYYGRELRAVRKDRWKLYFPHSTRSYIGVEAGKDGFPGPYARIDIGLELYDLKNDISENNNLVEQHPQIVEDLKKLADKARKELGDRLTDQKGKEVRKAGRRETKYEKVNHMAVGSEISFKKDYHKKYTGGKKNALIDGNRGSTDFSDGYWQGWEGDDLEAIIDLKKKQKVAKVTCGFLEAQHAWIFLPRQVEISLSKDGINFTNQTIAKSKESKYNPSPKVREYATDFDTEAIQFIRVIAKNIGICPDWHPGNGGKAWLFADEILVN